jgi:hypothetical protein
MGSIGHRIPKPKSMRDRENKNMSKVMTKEDKTYNGWTNYETWNVALWLDNERGTYDLWRERAKELLARSEATSYLTKEEGAVYDLARGLREEIEGQVPDFGASMYTDLLNAALSEVNWAEIARHYIEESKEDK